MNRKSNHLIIIENGELKDYSLDNKLTWDVGRKSKDNDPDIIMHVPTVSRKQGIFKNLDSVWFYVDYKGKNNTILNKKPIGTGLGGRLKPVILRDGDVLLFGGREKAEINSKIVWAYFSVTEYEGEWRVADTKGYNELHFISGNKRMSRINPDKGDVIKEEDGIAIYMGDITYLKGNMDVFPN